MMSTLPAQVETECDNTASLGMLHLPSDVVLLIARLCVNQDADAFSARSRVVLSCVCHAWRDALIQNRTLWTMIDCSHPNAALAFFERSAPLPISVRISSEPILKHDYKNREERNGFISILLAILHDAWRVKELITELDSNLDEDGLDVDPQAPIAFHTQIDRLLRDIQPTLSNIHTLRLFHTNPSNTKPPEEDHINRHSVLFPNQVPSALRVLWLRHSSLRLEAFIHCPLTSLRLHTRRNTLSPAQWRELLTALAPNLQDLRLFVHHGNHHLYLPLTENEAQTANNPPLYYPKILALPVLRTLVLDLAFDGWDRDIEARPLIYQLALPHGVRARVDQQQGWFGSAAQSANQVFSAALDTSTYSLSHCGDTFCMVEVGSAPTCSIMSMAMNADSGRSWRLSSAASRGWGGYVCACVNESPPSASMADQFSDLHAHIRLSVVRLRLYDCSVYADEMAPPWRRLSEVFPSLTELTLGTGPRQERERNLLLASPPRALQSSLVYLWIRDIHDVHDPHGMIGEDGGDGKEGPAIVQVFPGVTSIRLEGTRLHDPEGPDERTLLVALSARRKFQHPITLLHLDKWSSISQAMRRALGQDIRVQLEASITIQMANSCDNQYDEQVIVIPYDDHGDDGRIWKGRCLQEGRVWDEIMRWLAQEDDEISEVWSDGEEDEQGKDMKVLR
jgi:hypothetical protein